MGRLRARQSTTRRPVHTTNPLYPFRHLSDFRGPLWGSTAYTLCNGGSVPRPSVFLSALSRSVEHAICNSAFFVDVCVPILMTYHHCRTACTGRPWWLPSGLHRLYQARARAPESDRYPPRTRWVCSRARAWVRYGALPYRHFDNSREPDGGTPHPPFPPSRLPATRVQGTAISAPLGSVASSLVYADVPPQFRRRHQRYLPCLQLQPRWRKDNMLGNGGAARRHRRQQHPLRTTRV